MSIKVKTYYGYPQEICVVVDGECNHADVHFETEQMSYDNEYGQTEVWDDHLYVCNKCGAYRDATIDDSDWEGITELPMAWGGF